MKKVGETIYWADKYKKVRKDIIAKVTISGYKTESGIHLASCQVFHTFDDVIEFLGSETDEERWERELLERESVCHVRQLQKEGKIKDIGDHPIKMYDDETEKAIQKYTGIRFLEDPYKDDDEI